jgi:hypothetical protein
MKTIQLYIPIFGIFIFYIIGFSTARLTQPHPIQPPPQHDTSYGIEASPETINWFAGHITKPQNEPDFVQHLIDHPKRPVESGWWIQKRWAAILKSHPELAIPDFIDANGDAHFFNDNEKGKEQGVVEVPFFFPFPDERAHWQATFSTDSETCTYFMGEWMDLQVKNKPTACFFIPRQNANKIRSLLEIRYIDYEAERKAEKDAEAKREIDLDNGILPKST